MLVLEGGPHLTSAQAFRTHQWPYEFRYRDLKGFFTTKPSASDICGRTKQKSRSRHLQARASIFLECGLWAARHYCGPAFHIA